MLLHFFKKNWIDSNQNEDGNSFEMKCEFIWSKWKKLDVISRKKGKLKKRYFECALNYYWELC